MPYIGKSPEFGVRQRYYFTQSSGGGTSVSGTDDNGITLKFTDGNFVDVFLNGVLLVDGTDYGTSTANTISNLSAMASGDVVEVLVYDVFNIAKNQAEVTRTRYYKTASGGETSISGNDDSGVAIQFEAGAQLDVSLNGVSLVAGSDYNTSTANTIGGLTALTAGNVIEIVKYEKFVVSDTVSKAAGGTFSGNVSMGGTLSVTGTTTFSGDVVGAVQEYFEVNLTSNMTSIADQTSTVVDFGGSGAVVYDTKSKFDSTNDAYLLGSSDGVYFITFSCGVRSNNLGNTSGDLIAGMAGIEIATDGSTFAGHKVNSETMRNSDQDSGQSMTLTGSFIYKATTATTKIRLTAVCEMTGSDTWVIDSTGAGLFQTSVTSNLNTARPTFMSVIRIA